MTRDDIETADPRAAPRRDAALALLVALLLSVSWAIARWDALALLILPDTDDMMRLAQIRDWIGGQAMNDWTQYRVAPPGGAPMHWSRLNDLVPAATILALRPLIGTHTAELAAALLYPAALLAMAAFLSARIARRLAGPSAGWIAIVLMALCYPGTALFLPGRLDHHALQVVVTQLAVLATMRAPSRGSGFAAGALFAVSLMIGLETAPQVAALMGILFVLWVADGTAERGRLAGAAAGLGGTTLLFLGLMRPTYWTAEYCDAFTPAAATGMLAGAVALALFALLAPRLSGPRARALAGAVIGAAALGTVLVLYPACLQGPYGEVSPFLQANFIAAIDEANSLFEQPSLARAISLAGILAVACVVALVRLVRAPQAWRRVLPIAAAVWMSLAVTLFQVRGVYLGAPLAVPLLAAMVTGARARASGRPMGGMLLIGAWLLAAGVIHREVPTRLAALAGAPMPPSDRDNPRQQCNTGEAWRQFDRYPPGVTMASTNLAAYLIGATHHSTVGAGYHRNDTANMAMYRFFLSPPERAAAVARKWRVRYVLFCPGDFTEKRLLQRCPDSVAARLDRGETPPGFERLPLRDARLRLYRIGPWPER